MRRVAALEHHVRQRFVINAITQTQALRHEPFKLVCQYNGQLKDLQTLRKLIRWEALLSYEQEARDALDVMCDKEVFEAFDVGSMDTIVFEYGGKPLVRIDHHLHNENGKVIVVDLFNIRKQHIAATLDPPPKLDDSSIDRRIGVLGFGLRAIFAACVAKLCIIILVK